MNDSHRKHDHVEKCKNIGVCIEFFKEDRAPKMKSLSSFTHHYVVPNLYAFLSSAGDKIRYFKERWEPNNIRAH